LGHLVFILTWLRGKLDVFGGGREELLTGKSFYTIVPDAVLHAPAGGQLKKRAWARDAPMSSRIKRDPNSALDSRQEEAFPVIVDSGVVGTLLPEGKPAPPQTVSPFPLLTDFRSRQRHRRRV
jgi:hypothetical protein